jgi:iron complex transport system substrate-binding protein
MMSFLSSMPGKAMALLAIGLAFCTPPALAHETTDLSGASRIVAVGGSVTEIVYALGEEDRLVARDTTSVYPREALKLPDIGYMRALSPEAVLSVDPDAIIMLEGSGPAEAVEVLKKASVPIVTVPERFDREGIVEKIEVIGAALGVQEEAAALADRVEHDIEAAMASAAASDGKKPRVLFVLSTQGGKIMASGTDTAANGIIEMAGAENAMTEYSGYKQLTDEALITAAPEIILTMRTAGPSISDDALFAMPAVAATPAGKTHRVVSMDGAYLLGFGPRTASAIRDLAAALHGAAQSE